MRDGSRQDQGVAMVGYALIVVLVAIAGVTALQLTGNSTSDSFESVATAIPGEPATRVELTPEEKWEKAKEDYKSDLAKAKATKKDMIAQATQDKKDTVNEAKAQYNSALKENKALPKAERKAANKIAKDDFNAAKKSANQTFSAAKSAANQAQKDAVNKAKADYASARAEWKAYQNSK